MAGHPYGHFLQGAGWARLRSAYGWRCRRLLLEEPAGGGCPAVGAQVLIRTTPVGPFAYVARGPVCDPRSDAWPSLLRALRAVSRGCVALRLEPHWRDETGSREVLLAAGLRESEPTQPPSTVRICLDVERDALLEGMKQKWRYNVRLAERHGVRVTTGTAADLPAFERLMEITARRDRFTRREAGYYAAAWRALGDAARLYVAHLGDEALAAILVVHHGRTATYLYGASSEARRDTMPNHALQWQAMSRARSEGCTVYDLWGIPDPIGRAAASGQAIETVPAGTGGLWGVWGFKRGFGGRVWRSVGAWDDVYRRGRYWLATSAAPMARRLAGRWPR